MLSHSGELVKIREVSSYHMDVPLYEFEELSGIWPEEALCDPLLERVAEGVHFELASLHYSMRFEVIGEFDGVVQIVGLSDGAVYCSLRRSNVEWIAKSIQQVLELRSKQALETLFQFDGIS